MTIDIETVTAEVQQEAAFLGRIMAALETDWELKEKHDLLVSDIERLGKFSLSPDQNSTNNILSYAEKAIEELSASA